jgi:transposase
MIYTKKPEQYWTAPKKLDTFGGIFMFKRSKYDYTFRLRCVESVVNEGKSIGSVARDYGIESSNLRLWLSFYKQYGPPGLLPHSMRVYDPAFKLKVLETINQDSLSLSEACVQFSIPTKSMIIQWRRAYEKDGIYGLQPKRKGRKPAMKSPYKRKPRKSDKPLTREEELLKENEYLRAENELLKKLHALVQHRKKQQP